MTKVLFIGCNTNQLAYLKNFLSMNFNVIGTDINYNAPGKNLCNHFYQVSYTDHRLLLEIGYKHDFTKEDKVFTASSQFAHLSASIFAEKFGIKYPSFKNINIILDKKKFYKLFQNKDIPIPKTRYIKSHESLLKILSNKKTNYYLKSDFSKNPNYVYRLQSPYENLDRIFWGKDKYLKKYYILQEEFLGRHLRLNIYGDDYNIFDFFDNKLITDLNKQLYNFNIIQSLMNLTHHLELKNWIVKFDIVLSNSDFVVLDIGIDPPSRMRKLLEYNGYNFAKLYIQHQLFGKINYPSVCLKI